MTTILLSMGFAICQQKDSPTVSQEPASSILDPSVNFVGTWKNDRGSTMTITSSEKGIIRGYYHTAVGKPKSGEGFSLIGMVAGDQITFNVDYSAYGSLTTWAGQHTIEDGKEKIITMWYLTQNVKDADEPKKLWRGILSGSSVFHRI